VVSLVAPTPSAGRKHGSDPLGVDVKTHRLPVLLAALLAATPALAAPAAAPKARAPRNEMHELLVRQCRTHAADPKNPWALAHGVTGLGADFRARDGRRATQAMVADFLQKANDPRVGPYGFPARTADGTPADAHPNLLVKTLVQAGLQQGTTWNTAAGKVSLAQLVESARRGFHHVPSNDHYWEQVGWTLDLLASTLKPGEGAVFQNGTGDTIDFNQVMDDALAYLERANAALAAGMDAGSPSVPKNRQGIYSHPCGGLHLVQALGSWARHPEVRARWGKRWERQIEVLFYRVRSERPQYEAALQARPDHRIAVLTQMVKFYGHFLETTGRLKAEAGFTPSPEQLRDIYTARGQLALAVRQLDSLGAFQQMDRLRETQRQVWLDLIGDSCHAVNGWNHWP